MKQSDCEMDKNVSAVKNLSFEEMEKMIDAEHNFSSAEVIYLARRFSIVLQPGKGSNPYKFVSERSGQYASQVAISTGMKYLSIWNNAEMAALRAHVWRFRNVTGNPHADDINRAIEMSRAESDTDASADTDAVMFEASVSPQLEAAPAASQETTLPLTGAPMASAAMTKTSLTADENDRIHARQLVVSLSRNLEIEFTRSMRRDLVRWLINFQNELNEDVATKVVAYQDFVAEEISSWSVCNETQCDQFVQHLFNVDG